MKTEKRELGTEKMSPLLAEMSLKLIMKILKTRRERFEKQKNKKEEMGTAQK